MMLYLYKYQLEYYTELKGLQNYCRARYYLLSSAKYSLSLSLKREVIGMIMMKMMLYLYKYQLEYYTETKRLQYYL